MVTSLGGLNLNFNKIRQRALLLAVFARVYMQNVAQCYAPYLPEFVLKLSVNNQVTLGLQQVTRARRPTYDKASRINLPDEIAEYYKSGDAAYVRDRDSKHEYASTIAKNAIGDYERKWIKSEKRSMPTLDLTEKSQRKLETKSKVVGFAACKVSAPKKFGAKQGHKIRESGAALDILCNGDPSKARVITLTLAGDRPEAKKALACYSGYAINRLFQVVRRDYPECNNWFFVWEYQKRGALHLHIATYHDDKEISKEIGDRLIETWHNVLVDIGLKADCCMFTSKKKDRCTVRSLHQNVNQEMKKSCGGYFSKYASKGENGTERIKMERWSKLYSPSRFWGSSQSIKNVVRENSFSFNIEMLNGSEAMEVYEFCLEYLTDRTLLHYGEYQFKKQIEHEQGKKIIAEGFRQNFYVPPKDYQELLQKFRTVCKMFTVETCRPYYVEA